MFPHAKQVCSVGHPAVSEVPFVWSHFRQGKASLPAVSSFSMLEPHDRKLRKVLSCTSCCASACIRQVNTSSMYVAGSCLVSVWRVSMLVLSVVDACVI